MRIFESPSQALGAVGTELGVSEWFTIDQARIDAFADATEDHQWIHNDVERAQQGPFGSTIAHGMLTMSLLQRLVSETYEVHGSRMALNYGFDRVRFPSPVPAGARIRSRSTLASAQQIGEMVQLAIDTVIEIEGAEKPACVLRSLGRFVP